MKAQDLFCLFVRLSGYFTIFFAAYSVVGMVVGPINFSFGSFMVFAVYAVLGAAILKFAPQIGKFTYPDQEVV